VEITFAQFFIKKNTTVYKILHTVENRALFWYYTAMLELLGYFILTIGIATGIAIIVEIHNYLIAFICFWIGLTIASMLIMNFKDK
jgi:hypothetical protein